MMGNGYPSLVLEVSGTLSEGQLRIRVEVFLEMLSDRFGESPVRDLSGDFDFPQLLATP